VGFKFLILEEGLAVFDVLVVAIDLQPFLEGFLSVRVG
jgi:hypothetical protein